MVLKSLCKLGLEKLDSSLRFISQDRDPNTKSRFFSCRADNSNQIQAYSIFYMHIHRFDFELRPGLFHPQWREATYSTGESMVRIANNFSITCLYPLVANISCTNNIILYSTTHITIIISGSPRTPSPNPTDINTTHHHPKSNPFYTTFKHIPHPTPIYECPCVALNNVY